MTDFARSLPRIRRSGKAGKPAIGGEFLPGIRVRRDPGSDAGPSAARWWLAGDPVASAWFAALSATFPRGEAFFIESVRACRAGVAEPLAADIRAFIAQEANHSREHLALNRMLGQAGYDFARIESRLAGLLEMTRGRPPVQNLASTIVLEHFTAILAHDLLAHPAQLDGCGDGIAALWRWHAAEEIEHKGVAFDVFLHVTRDWPARRRWLLRSAMMLALSTRFFGHRVLDTLDLLAQGGITGWRARARLAWFLLGRPGVLRRIFPSWLAWFSPRFHPWDRDDRALLPDLSTPPPPPLSAA